MNKYAVRFPKFEDTHDKSVSNIFSERGIVLAEKNFDRRYGMLESLTELVIQKNRTSELGRQLDSMKASRDVEIENKTEQTKIHYEEKMKRLKAKLEAEKKQMEVDFQELKLETAQKAKNFSFKYEEYMKSNALLKKIIMQEKSAIEETHKYIENLEGNFSNSREYILYCDSERKSLELIEKYLKLMI